MKVINEVARPRCCTGKVAAEAQPAGLPQPHNSTVVTTTIMQSSPELVIAAMSRTLLSTAAESLLHELYPSASVRYEPSQSRALAAHTISVMLEGTQRWILVSADPSPRQIAEAFANGAWSVVSIDGNPAEFRQAVDSMIRGDLPFVPEGVSRRIATQAVRARTAEPTELPGVGITGREREVLALIAKGYSNAEIAAQLVMSANTVRTHLQALYSKFQAQSRLKMLARARELGIEEAQD